MPLDFSSYFVPLKELQPHVPAFRPVMIDLQAMEERDFRGSETIKAVLMTMKYSRRNLGAYLVEILRRVMSVPMDERHRAFVRSLLRYIIIGCRDVDEQDVDRAVRSVGSREVMEEYMTVAEQLIEKGKRAGLLEGKKEGILEGKQESLLKQLTQKFGPVSEADRRRIKEARDPDKLDRALGLILTSESTEEILRPLD